MSKIGFKLSACNRNTNKDTHVYVKPASTYYSRWETRIILRKDDEVRKSQIKGYKYLAP